MFVRHRLCPAHQSFGGGVRVQIAQGGVPTGRGVTVVIGPGVRVQRAHGGVPTGPGVQTVQGSGVQTAQGGRVGTGVQTGQGGRVAGGVRVQSVHGPGVQRTHGPLPGAGAAGLPLAPTRTPQPAISSRARMMAGSRRGPRRRSAVGSDRVMVLPPGQRMPL